MNKLPTIPNQLLAQMDAHPGEIEIFAPFIGCAGGIDGHTDEMFDPWSAFLCVRNDGCEVWQEGGYRGVPKPGERFTLCIHKMHGVNAPERGEGVIVLVHADGTTERKAKRALGSELRELRTA